MVCGMTEQQLQRRLLQRRAWDDEHMRTVGTKLSAEDNARLCAYCKRIGMTRYALLQSLILEALADAESS